MTWGVWRSASGFGSQIGGVVDVPDDAPAAYEGPGDIKSGAYAWYGLRAYSAARRGNDLIRLKNGAATEQNFASDATTGALDYSAISTFQAAGGGGLTIVTFFDDSGNGRDITIGGGSGEMAFVLTGHGAHPVIRSTADDFYESSGSKALTQPFSINAVQKRTANFTSFQNSAGLAGNGIGWADAADTAYMNGGANLTATASDSVMHSVLAMFNGGSSVLYVDGASGASGAGGATNPSGQLFLGGWGGGTFAGDVLEFGFWDDSLDAGEASDLYDQQDVYWGL
jgi:hypothetical protein